MNRQPSTLLIDAGNTRLKFALALSSGGVNTDPQLKVYDANGFDQLIEEMACTDCVKPTKALLASVRNDQQTQALIAELQIVFASIQVELIVPKQGAMGIECAYQDMSQLGVDRWLALLAAAIVLPQQHLLVVDCGTAITIDQLNRDRHLGGWIFPGIRMLNDSLYQRTGRVREQRADANVSDTIAPFDTFGRNTTACVRAASYHGVIGLLAEAIRVATATRQLDGILLTGGDGSKVKEWLQQRSSCPVFYREELVFEGMLQFVGKKV